MQRIPMQRMPMSTLPARNPVVVAARLVTPSGGRGARALPARSSVVVAAALVALACSSCAPARADEPARKTCETEYPRHLGSTPSGYSHDSQSDAFRALQRELEEVSLEEESRYSAGSGPCGSNGWQVKIRAKWKKSGTDAGRPASLMGCPICDDTSSGPKTFEKWRISYDD